jgi:hypothetical protein
MERFWYSMLDAKIMQNQIIEHEILYNK